MNSTLSSLQPGSEMKDVTVYSTDKSVLVMAVAWFMIIFSFSYIMLYAFKPSFVCITAADGTVASPKVPDSSKCVIGALVVALIVLVVVWLFRSSKY